jgi:hypothetical protein
MKYSLFAYLLWANPKSSANSVEQAFYDQNATLFNATLSVFNDNSSVFGIVRSDIVLRGLLNKKKIDDEVEIYSAEQLSSAAVNEAIHAGLPYLEKGTERIYIPSYSPSINQKYAFDLPSLKAFPYLALVKDSQASLVDPFETYGNLLYDSPFTRLVKLETHDVDSNVFYHPEFKDLFVIDNYGGLEQEIPIFDERMKTMDGSHLFDRLELLMKDYYANERDDFLHHLFTLNLISKPLYEELCETVNQADLRKAKRLLKK